jgi:hypothetical protein
MTRGQAALLVLAFLGRPVGAETLHYSINWQSGLSLGEASLLSEKLSAEPAGEAGGGQASGWKFEMALDAAVPGFTIRDEYSSSADDKLCSSRVQKSVARGARKTVEKTQIDSQIHSATRETQNGGKSQYEVPSCVHDAMAFLQFVRQELAQGRIPAEQPVVLGAKYNVQVTYVGTDTIRVAGENVPADRVKVAIKGPMADVTADVYFSHDELRTPVLARIPLMMGTFTVELIP